jgi:hypothetical protein
VSTRNRVARLLAALAQLSLIPAYLYIEANVASVKARPHLPEQKQRVTEALEGLRQRQIACNGSVSSKSTMTKSAIRELLDMAFNPTFDVNGPFQGETLFWSFERGLPYIGGLHSLFKASIAVQAKLARLTRELDLCRRIPDDDDVEAREVAAHDEEKRSQAWLDEQRQKIEELDRDLANARAAYEEDRPKLALVAWTLGVLQVVGWSLLYFVVLPQELRAWRQRRASKKGGST